MWETLGDKDLLGVRLRDLRVHIAGSWIEESLADLYDELARRDIRFRPHAWLSYDWFVPDGVPLVEASILDRDVLVRTMREHEVGGVVHVAGGQAENDATLEVAGGFDRDLHDAMTPETGSCEPCLRWLVADGGTRLEPHGTR